MPKTAETMLDRLARTLKAREHSIDRVDRRLSSWPEQVSRRGLDEARDLSRDLGQKSIMEFDRLMRSNPGLRVRRRAFDMMPDELLDDCRY
jgi:hypothetical protein